MHRNHRNAQPVHDLFQAPAEGQQVAGAADRAFRENADHVAGFELVARLLNGRNHVARAAGSHWNRLSEAEKPVQRGHLVVRLPDHEPDEALQAGGDEEPVDVRHMVRHQERGPADRNAVVTQDADSEERVRNQPQQEPDQELGHQTHCIDGGDQRYGAEDDHQLVGGEMQFVVEGPEGSRGKQESNGVVEVVGRNDAALFVALAALL